jgi:hypothetical protein
MKPEYTEKEQQAIDGVIVALDSLPGYKKQPIYFNGNYVGYKYEKVTSRSQIWSKFRVWPEDLKRMLKWNW